MNTHKSKALEYVKSADEKLLSNDYQGAIEDYSKAVDLEPAFAKHYCFRGVVKSEHQDYHGGIGDFTKAVELDPNYAMAYLNRAMAFLGIGRKLEALADFLKAKEFGIRIPQGTWDKCL